MDDGGFGQNLSEAGSGDRRALTELYARYNRMLVRYLRAQVPGVGAVISRSQVRVLSSQQAV